MATKSIRFDLFLEPFTSGGHTLLDSRRLQIGRVEFQELF